MDVREKLVELLKEISYDKKLGWYDLCDMRDGAEDIADLLIANGAMVQEWISVKERLPDKRGEYLCYYKFQPDSPDVICENTYQGSGLWLSEKDKVTHWCALPQPPKGE